MRLGAAVLLEAQAALEVNGLRRALGDRALQRIDPHITLVPPVNVRAERLGEALALMRAAAGRCDGPLALTLGPPATFLPDNPVLMLPVGGDVEGLAMLQESVFRPPLERPLAWPWVPHVTLFDGGDDRDVIAAAELLAGFSLDVVVSALTLLVETRPEGGPRWVPLADAFLRPVAVVGRGSLELVVTHSSVIDPEASALLSDEEVTSPWTSAPGAPLVVTGRRGGAVVGLAVAWRNDAGGNITVFVAREARRQGVGSHLLAHLEAAVREAGWDCPVLAAVGPAGFYRARSSWSLAR